MGMYGRQSLQQFKAFDSANLSRSRLPLVRICTLSMADRLDQYNPAVDGYVFSAGGPIWGLDWCPYPESASVRTYELLNLTIPELMVRLR